jgi:hypothetical protein
MIYNAVEVDAFDIKYSSVSRPVKQCCLKNQVQLAGLVWSGCLISAL